VVVLVACEPATPSRVVAEEVIAAPPVVALREAPVVVDAVVADRYPSLAYYPDLGAKVAAARADGARAVLAADRGEFRRISLAERARLGSQWIHRSAGGAAGLRDAGVGIC
jgi:hypothetical protein